MRKNWISGQVEDDNRKVLIRNDGAVSRSFLESLLCAARPATVNLGPGLSPYISRCATTRMVFPGSQLEKKR